jgi:phenylacetate-CoA ligase
MKFLPKNIKRAIKVYRSNKTTEILSTLDPEKLQRTAEKELRSQYISQVKEVPFYRKLLAEKGDELKGAVDFKRFCEITPVIDKTIFERFPLESFVKPRLSDQVESFYTSSGSSGTTFSFNAQSRIGNKKIAPLLESRLDYLFKIHSRPSLIVNCLPMGIAIPTESMPVINCGTREDAIIYLVKRLHEKYEQLIFVGEYLFLKKVIEGLHKQTNVLKQRVISIITGGEYIPESYREYIGQMAGFDYENPDKGMLFFSMGASELSISIMFEDASTMKLRRYFHKNLHLLKQFSKKNLSYVPHIMQYIPVQNFVEVNCDNEIIISNLNKSDPVQLLRYNTKDKGSIYSWSGICEFLEAQQASHLQPKLKLPLCFLEGKNYIQQDDGSFINPNIVKTEIYGLPEVAAKLTGNFRIQNNASPLNILFQLIDSESLDLQYQQKLEEKLRTHLRDNIEMALKFIPFHSFPYNMELNYQKKMKYTD